MNSQIAEKPSRQAIGRAIAAATLDLRPVRRLPSDGVLIGLAMLVFICLSVAVGFALGMRGFQQFSTAQRLLYYGTLLGCGALLASVLAPQIVPGAKRRMSLAAALLIPLLATSICAAVIFPQANFDRFVPLGIPCLRAGLLCATGSGALAFLLLRRGYLATPLQTSVLSAAFAGFTGVAMLSLHCPQQNWIHVLAWHLGAPVICGLTVWVSWQLRLILRLP